MREGDDRTGAALPVGRRLRAGGVTWPSMLALVCIGLGLLVHTRAWVFICDDAFISFRYARNLARHGQLVYNLAPFERVEGYTNLLWVLVLAVGDALGLAPERLAPVLTAASALVILLLLALIGARLRRADAPFELVDLLGPALLVTLPEFVVWASSGLETSFAVALGLLAVWLWLDARIEGAALAAAAAGLTRMDALVWIAAFGLGWLVWQALELRGRKPTIPWRRLLIATVLFAAPLLISLVFRRIYYGAWLPNTWAIKQHGAALRDTYGVAYLEWWVSQLHVVYLAPLLVLVRGRHLPVIAAASAVLVWVWSIGGDFMAYGRFMLPATCLLALLVGVWLAELRTWAQTRGLSATRAWLGWGVVAIGLVSASASRIPARLAEDRAHAHLHLHADAPGFESVDGMQRFAAVRVAAGERLAALVPPDTLITVGAAGALPYASMLPAYDSYGLVDPGVIAAAQPQREGARPGHQLHAPFEYMAAHEPDLMCHIGYAGERPPPRGLDRRMGAGRGWVGWTCVETGPIADPRAGTLPSHYYCCMHRRRTP